MASTRDILSSLASQGVEFVIVDGTAAVFHGSAQVTEDLDVCAPFSRANVERILEAIRPLRPRWRMSPERPPLADDAEKLATYRNLYLVTDSGQLDVLSEISGIGSCEQALHESVEVEVDGRRLRILSVEALIRAKRVLGRPRDLQTVAELEALRTRWNRPRES